ncbi:MAG: purine-nucleoside phosphorylase [Rhodobacteraceae bacterium]|nr:purine-nucleoside phosphorylase [Paracoccaceae bacterium]
MLDNLEEMIATIERASNQILSKIGGPIECLLMLGTGLGSIANRVEVEFRFSYKEIPGFPVSTAPTHEGNLIIGKIGSKRVAIMQGRFHLYEGWTPSQIAMPIRVIRKLGATRFLVTNAAGGLNMAFKPGDVMIIQDHINMTGLNPLVGPHDDRLGLRFPDMSDPYDKNLQNIVNQLFEKYDITVAKGIYIGITGPSLETSAERRFLAQCGGDAVGMSTVMEVIAAKQAGFQIIGLSAITNKADGGPDQKPDTIEDVLLNATTAGQKILKILPDLLENW